MAQPLLEIDEINSGNGYVLLNESEIKITHDYKRIMHIIDLDQYRDCINKLESNIIQLHEKTKIRATLLYNLKHLKEDFSSIIPHHISKRGLLNIVGKGLRYLTGVMDNNDRDEIQKHYEIIELNNRNIIKNLNDQISINSQISDQMENITNHINEVQNKVTVKINEFQNHISKLDQQLHFFIITTEINENINILAKQISKIKEIILASKLEILPRDIFTQEEIQDNNITVEMLPHIKNCVLFKENVIVFVLSIPNFVKNLYTRVLIKKIPNKNNSLELSTNVDRVIISKQTIYVNVNKKTISQKELIPYKDQCISNLLNNKIMKCNFIRNVTEEIEAISDNVIITKNLNETFLINNCGEQLGIKIKGNNIIKFVNCKISIGTFQQENLEAEYHGKVLPNIEREITIEEVVNELNLDSLYFKHINNTHHLEEIKLSNTRRWYTNLTTNMIIAAAVLIIVLYLFIRCRGKQTEVKIQLESRRQESTLEEGGVTSTPFSFSPFT